MNVLQNPEPEFARQISVGEVVRLYLRGDTSQPKDPTRPYWLISDVPDNDQPDPYFIAMPMMPINPEREEWEGEGSWPDNLDPAEWKIGWPGTLDAREHAFRLVGRLSLDEMIGMITILRGGDLSPGEAGVAKASYEARYKKPAFILGRDTA